MSQTPFQPGKAVEAKREARRKLSETPLTVDDGSSYAAKPGSIRPLPLAPQFCSSCGARLPEGQTGCAACEPGEGRPTEDLGREEPVKVVADSEPRQPVFAVGQSFGPRYTIVEHVASGGMGAVYKAIDTETSRTVALKLIRSDVIARTGTLSRFKRELTLAQTVSHPNVYRVHDLGVVDGTAYISMEYIEGQSLDDLVRTMGHLSPRQTVSIGKQLCAGLHAIHEKSILHRDVKPSNIMLDHSGVARLMDFGLAYQAGSDHLTSEGHVLGTMAYLSPEQARGERVGVPSDVFAVGLILYEMLTGKRPPGDGKAAPFALRDAAEYCPPPSRFVPEIPKAIDAIVMRCLDRNPAKRFPSAEALGVSLASAATTQSSKIALRSLGRPTGPFVVQSSSRWPWVLAGAAALVAAVFAVRPWFSPAAAPVTAAVTPPILGIVPFAIDGDAAARDFSIGLADGLATDIGDGQCATVVSRSETAPLEAANTDAAGIARRLGLTHVLMVGLSRSPAGYRVETNLLAAGGNVVSRVADVDADAFALQRRVANGVIGALCVGTAASVHSTSAGTTNANAFLEYSRGLRLLDRPDQPQNVKDAIASLERAVNTDPRFVLAQVALGEAYLAQYRLTTQVLLPGRALNAATDALRLAPTQPRARVLYARVKQAMGESRAAASELQDLLKERPGDPEAHAALASLYTDQTDWTNALAEYEEARKLRPDYWRSYFRLGYVYLRMGRWKDAVNAYTRSTSLQPDSAEAWQHLGAAHQAEGNLKQAAESYQKAISIQPHPLALHNLATIYFDDGDFSAAKRTYEQAVRQASRLSAPWRGLGDANAMLGRAAEAKQAWSECARLAHLDVGLNKENSKALAEEAVCEMKLGNKTKALADIERAVAISPRNGDVLYDAALICLLDGRESDALATLKQAIDNGYSARQAQRDYEFRRLRATEGFRAATGGTSAGGGK